MENDFRIYSYIMVADTGFAPNPFHGICTLACCKPVMRRNAKIGDWIVGIRGKQIYDHFIKRYPSCAEKDINKIIYIMQITEDPMEFQEYYERYPKKIPQMNSSSTVCRSGDNIYRLKENQKFQQLPSMHAKKINGSWEEDEERKGHDLDGKFVLISKKFYYFGRNNVNCPKLEDLKFLIKKGPGHKCNFNLEEKEKFLAEINGLGISPGLHGNPHSWPEDDQSWKDYETFRNKCGC